MVLREAKSPDDLQECGKQWSGGEVEFQEPEEDL